MAFQVEHAGELLVTAQYLLQFDDTIKFKLTLGARRRTMQLTTVNVPPFSYTTVDLIDEPEQPHKIPVVEPHAISWALNAGFFVSVLACFDPQAALTIEIARDLSCVLLCQRKQHNAGAQVAQIGALHDLGPKLLVDHDVGELYRIPDLRNFVDVVRSVRTSADEDRCRVSLHQVSPTEWELTMKTTMVTSSMLLRFEKAQQQHQQHTLKQHLEGSARCDDLHEFARLCTRMCKLSESASLLVGFGSDGIALFRFEWIVESGIRTANLFFCGA